MTMFLLHVFESKILQRSALLFGCMLVEKREKTSRKLTASTNKYSGVHTVVYIYICIHGHTHKERSRARKDRDMMMNI